MSRVSLHIIEEKPGRLECKLEGIDPTLQENVTFASDEFFALPMPQRFGLTLNEALKQTDLGRMIMEKCLPPQKIEVGEEDFDPAGELVSDRIKYPCRCRIIDPEGEVVAESKTQEAVALATPSASVPHMGRTGTAYKEGNTVRIELDGGGTLMGYECWWEPINDTN